MLVSDCIAEAIRDYANYVVAAQDLPPRTEDAYALNADALIHRVPDEILVQFFQSAVDIFQDPFGHAGPQKPLPASPITISHVCAQWRDVAFATPRLWTSITLFYLHTTPEEVCRLMLSLLRSENCPLDVILDFRDPNWDADSDSDASLSSTSSQDDDSEDVTAEEVHAVLNMPYLKQSVHRWRSFCMYTDTWQPLLALLEYAQLDRVATEIRDAPLDTLHLAQCNAYIAGRGACFCPPELLHILPLFGIQGGNQPLAHLRDVSLSGCPVDWNAAASALQDLRVLELKYLTSDVMPSVTQFHSILSGSPELENLAVVGHGLQRGDNDEPLASVVLQNLRKITLGFLDADDAILLIRGLHIPAVQELSLEHVPSSLSEEEPGDTDDAQTLLRWLCDANAENSIDLPSILELRLVAMEAEVQVFTRFFGACSRLVTLRLGGPSSYEHKNALAARNMRPGLLPETLVHRNGVFVLI